MSRLDPALRLVFFGDEAGASYRGALPERCETRLLSSRGSRFDVWERLALPWAAASARCDVLHCTSSSAPGWAPMPVVLTVHDLIPMLIDDGQSAAEAERFKARLQRGLARAATVIAVSESTRRDLLAHFPNDAAKCGVVYWGKPSPHAASQADRAPRKRPYLLAFGGTAPRKNTAYTLDRFAAALQERAEFDLVLVGISSPTQRAALAAQAARRGVDERVVMPGFVSEDELAGLLRGAVLVLYLSAYEGFGLPVVEAVAHGVPVVASNTSALPELLSDGESCHPLDRPMQIEAQIRRLCAEPDYRRARWQVQADSIARFDWTATARRTLQLLRGAAAGEPALA